MLITRRWVFWFFSCGILLLSCQVDQDHKSLEVKTQEVKNKQQRAVDTLVNYRLAVLKEIEEELAKDAALPDSLRAENDHLIGLHYQEQGDLDSAASYLYRSTEYIQKGIQSRRQVDYFYKIWDIYRKEDRLGDCLAISSRFRDLLDPEGDYRWWSWYYFFEENVYKKQRKLADALHYNQQRIDMLIQAGDTLKLTPALVSRAYVKFIVKEKEEAFEIFEQLSRQEAQLTDDFKRQVYGTYGALLFWDEQYQLALKQYFRGLKFSRKTESQSLKARVLSTAYSNIGEVYMELKDYEKANLYLDSALVFLPQIDDELQLNTLRYKLRLDMLMGKGLNAVYQQLDSISYYLKRQYDFKMNRELVALGKANENEQVLLAENQKREIENIRLESRLLLLGLLTCLLAAIGFLFYRQRKHRFERQQLQMQQRLLRTQMNPHFTFNTLYAIQNLVESEPKSATKYLLKFSRLLRLILDNSMKNYVQLEKELNSLRQYLDLQLLRFPSKFQYQIRLNDLDEEDFIFIPPMLLQPIVENCIEHGFSGIDYPGKINIELSLEGTHVHCKIEDNGRGLHKQTSLEKQSASTRLIAAFLEKVNHSKLEVINKAELDVKDQGVLVQFLIPFKTSEDD